MEIGITGSRGFIGGHIKNYLKSKGIKVYDLNNDLLRPIKLPKLDIIIHTAAINRGNNQDIISGSLVATHNLLSAIKNQPKIIYLSSIHAKGDSVYGQSKRLTEIMLEDFSRQNNSPVAILRLTNVFGPGCQPFYNSVVATFCYQVINSEELKIDNNKKINFIYIKDLIKIINKEIFNNYKNIFRFKEIEPKNSISINNLAKLISSFKDLENPQKLKTKLHRDLYETYLSYLPEKPEIKADERGKLIEIFKNKNFGQIIYLTTKPGITRGNHYHKRKKEYFCVIEGKAEIKLRNRQNNKIIKYKVSGDKPEIIDTRTGWAHNITNTGKKDMKLLIWINEIFDPQNPDTYYEKV